MERSFSIIFPIVKSHNFFLIIKIETSNIFIYYFDEIDIEMKLF